MRGGLIVRHLQTEEALLPWGENLLSTLVISPPHEPDVRAIASAISIQILEIYRAPRLSHDNEALPRASKDNAGRSPGELEAQPANGHVFAQTIPVLRDSGRGRIVEMQCPSRSTSSCTIAGWPCVASRQGCVRHGRSIHADCVEIFPIADAGTVRGIPPG